MADIKKINVNGTLYDVNLDSTKDVDIKSLKVNDGDIVVGTGDYESMTTASKVTISDTSIFINSKTPDASDEIEITVDPGGGSYMSVGMINSTEVSAGTVSANNVEAAHLKATGSLTVGSQTITNLNDLRLKNVSQTEGDTAFLTVFTNPSDIPHKLHVSSAYIEELATEVLSCDSVATFTGSLTVSEVVTPAITLGGVRKTAWPESGGSNYSYITENISGRVITVGTGVIGTAETSANTLNLRAGQITNIVSPTINLNAASSFSLNSSSINVSNGQITLNPGNGAVGTLSALGLSIYDGAINKVIKAGVISTDDNGAINHTFTGTIVVSDPEDKKLQITSKGIKYYGDSVINGTILHIYNANERNNYMHIGLGDTFVGSLVAEGLYIGGYNTSYKHVMTLDGNDNTYKTAYIGSTNNESIQDFKFCGTLLNSTGNSSPKIYYTNSKATTGVDNMKAALDDLYNRVAALGN